MAEFHGQLSLRAEPRPGGCTVLGAQSFRAPFHLSKPYWDEDSGTLLVQVVNPTAGILSGDRLESSVTVCEGASLLLTTPSASRLFKMREGSAQGTQRFQVEEGGWLEVMPEPLVPHAGSLFHQRTQVSVAPGGGLFYADLLMPGRVAHGEVWSWGKLVLELGINFGNELILRERLDMDGPGLKALAGLTGAGEGACLGNVVVVAPNLGGAVSPAWRDEVHNLAGEGLFIGASQLRGAAGWSIKFVAGNGVLMRKTMASLRRILRPFCPHLACDARKL